MVSIKKANVSNRLDSGVCVSDMIHLMKGRLAELRGTPLNRFELTSARVRCSS
jgi:hypothetical protein